MIRNLQLTNYRCFSQASLLDLKKFIWIFGPNNSGKSTVLMAVHDAIVAPAAKARIRDGASSFKVDLDCAGASFSFDQGQSAGVTSVKGMPITKKLYQEAVCAELGVDLRYQNVIGKTVNFTSLPPEEAQSILFQIYSVDTKITKLYIQELFVGWCKARNVAPFAIGAADGEETGWALLDTVYDRAFEMRRELKKTRGMPEEVKPFETVEIDGTPVAIAIDDMEAIIQNAAAIERQRTELLMAIGKDSYSKEELAAELSGLDPAALEKDLKQAHDRVKKLKALQEKKSQLALEIATFTAALEAIEKKHCPLLSSVKCEQFSHTQVAEIEQKVELMRGQAERAGQDYNKLFDKGYDVALLEAKKRRYDELKERLAKAEASQEDSKKREQLKAFEVGLELNRKKLNALSNLKQQYDAYLNAIAKYERDQDTLNKVELVCQAFKSDLKAIIISDLLEEAKAQINALLEAISDGNFSVRFIYEDGFKIKVERNGTTDEISSLSESERHRLAVAFQVVLNRKIGLKLLLIDRADILDVENRIRFVEYLDYVTQQFTSVFISCTINSGMKLEDSSLVSRNDTSVYLIAKDEPRQINLLNRR